MDPRRPQNVHKFVIVNGDPNDPDSHDLTPDYMALLSMLCGLGGMMLKIQPVSLLSLFFCLVSLANLDVEKLNFQSIFSSVSVSIMAIVMSYREEMIRIRS